MGFCRPTDAFTRSSFTLWVESEVVVDAQTGKQFFEPSPESLLGHMQWLMTRAGAEFSSAARAAGPKWLQSLSSTSRHNCTAGWTQCRDRDLLHGGYSWESVSQTFLRLAEKHLGRQEAPSRRENAQVAGLQGLPAQVEIQELRKELQRLSEKIAALEQENSELRSQLHNHGGSLDTQAAPSQGQGHAGVESVLPQAQEDGDFRDGENEGDVESFDFFL